MDSFEFNKIAGAVLSALLVAFGSGTLLEVLGAGDSSYEKPGYELEVQTAAATTDAGKPEAAAFDPAKVVSMVAQTDPKVGAGVFARCKSCHSVDKSGKSTPTGPNLWGVVGRKVGGQASYDKYSSALKAKDATWDYKLLAEYIHNPRATIPGNRMSFAGLKDEGQLAGLIAYLRTLSDNPPALPN
ncbi:MAG: hypothetical protein RLZ98_462 [Pseudomonadota bacterium]|jgi:cytochrome c